MTPAKGTASGSAEKLDFRKEAEGAVAWNAGFGLFRDLVQFGTMLVLVRLIAPAAYGQFGLVTSIIGFGSVFGFHNFVAHTLQVRDDRDLNYQLHFTAGAAFQTTLFLLVNAAALLLRFVPDFEQVAPLVHVASLTLLLEWPSELRIRVLERLLDWRRRRLLHGIGLVLSALVAVVMATAGCGVYALIVPGMLVTLPFIWDLFAGSGFRPTWEWSRTKYAPAIAFGLARMVAGVAGRGQRLLENSGLAALFSFAALGHFGRAVGLSQILCAKLVDQLLYALYPLLTKLPERSDASRRAAGLVLRLVLWTVIPLALLGTLVSESLVSLVYGQQWLEVIPLLPRALAVTALAAVTQAETTLLLANNRERWSAAVELLNLLLTAVALWLFAPQGVVVYLGALVAMRGVTACMALAMLGSAGAVRATSVIASALSASLAGLAGLGASLWVARWLAAVPVFPRLATVAGAFGVAHLLVLRLLFKRQLIEVLDYAPGRHLLRALLLVGREDAAGHGRGGA